MLKRKYSTLSVVVMLSAWFIQSVLNSPFVSEFFRPNLGGGLGFPFRYFVWRDFGPPFSEFHWWCLFANVGIGLAVAFLAGFWTEKLIVERIRKGNGTASLDTLALPTAGFFSRWAASLSVLGVLLPIATWDQSEPARSVAGWLSCEVLALVCGVLGWKERTAKIAVIIAAIVVALPAIVYLVRVTSS